MTTDALPMGTIGLALLLTLLPFALLATTSFVKLSVVLSLLRNAIGLSEVPSGMVITLLAGLLSLLVMAPVAEQVGRLAERPLSSPQLAAPLSAQGREAWRALGSAVAEPVRAFLLRHAGHKERALFKGMAQKARPGSKVSDKDLPVLLPAFLVTELSEALQLGFIVFLPFLVVDVLVATLLTALGMTSISAVTISLPLKLLLFVMVDGFYLLSEALVSGYL